MPSCTPLGEPNSGAASIAPRLRLHIGVDQQQWSR
jgi:hypothetical protein